jgi:hypothetical protein
VRPANLREDRVDRRLFGNRSGKRRPVVVLRQRGGRTLTRTFLREADGRIREGALPSGPSSRPMKGRTGICWSPRSMRRITHAEAYSRDGVHTNHAESYFSRLRRMISGQHHRVGEQHLAAYAVHAAWLEDHRDRSNGALADRLISGALAAPISRGWKGDWRRRAA